MRFLFLVRWYCVVLFEASHHHIRKRLNFHGLSEQGKVGQYSLIIYSKMGNSVNDIFTYLFG